MDKSATISVIDAGQTNLGLYLLKVWSYRSLCVQLCRRELKIKYTQTILGICWALVQPLTGLLIFTFIFGRWINVDTSGIPYPLFAFTGMMAWLFFAQIMSGGGSALLESQQLIQKIYFPKMILLLAKCLTAAVELMICLALLLVVLIVSGKPLHLTLLVLPFWIGYAFLAGLAFAIWLSAVTVRRRDFLYLLPYLVNMGIWVTPVFYPVTLVPDNIRWILFLNPMAAVVGGFRWALLGSTAPETGYVLSLVPVILLLLTGIQFFRKTEDEIADYL